MGAIPPDEDRCLGIYGERYRQRPELRGQRCEQPKRPGTDFCNQHFIPDERRCTHPLSKTHPTRPGERCPLWALKGQHICGIHGGHTRQNKAAATRRIATEKLERQMSNQLARLDVDAVDNPLKAMSQLAGQVVAWQNALAEKVNALADIRYEDAKGGEQLRAEVVLYERAMDRCNTVLGTISRLNIDERMVVISEKQAERVIGAIDAVLEFLGVTGEQAVAAKRVAAKKLRAV